MDNNQREYAKITRSSEYFSKRLLGTEPFFDDKLKGIFECPDALYVEGKDHSILNHSKIISIIGTRSPFYKAFEIGESVGRIAGSLGITVVSGYATGIDTSGHLGAMDAEGKTIAVLGSGINIKEPKKPGLERYILENGIFISEKESPDEPRSYKSLMERDRITAGLSDAVFVIETDPNGGAVHTAKIAKKFQREVYAIDWDSSTKYKEKHLGGNIQIIKEGIAKPIPILEGDKEFEDYIKGLLESIANR